MIYQIKEQKLERKMPGDKTIFESRNWPEVKKRLTEYRKDRNVYVAFGV